MAMAASSYRWNSEAVTYDVWLLDLAYLDSPPMLLSGAYSMPGNRNLLTDFEGQYVTWFAEAYGDGGTAIVCNVLTGETSSIEQSARAEMAGTKVLWLADDGDMMLRDLVLDEDLEIAGDTGQPVWNDVLPSAIGRRFLMAQWAGPGMTDLGFGTILEPDVTATTAKSTVSYGTKPKITGTVRDLGLPVGNGAVHLQYSYDGINWNEPSTAATGRTTSTGTFSITVPMAVTETIRWRAVYDGLETDDGPVQHLSSASNSVRVTSPMVLSAPSRPSGARHGVYFKTTGTCKPGLDEDVKWLRVQAYKYERGKWRYKSSWYAYGAMISGKPGYRASVKPSSAGTWKLRAYWPSSASHPATYGPWCRSFTVK